MINTKYLLYISTCLLFSGNVQASDIKLTYDSSSVLPDSYSFYTLHTPSKLKPTSLFNSDSAIKLAAICSLANGGGNCGELHFDSMKTDCENEGYVKTCPEGQVKDGNRKCPYDSSYAKCRAANDSCNADYSKTGCSDTQVAVSAYQNEAGNTCYQCRDKTCAEGGYTDSLTSCQKGSTVSFANKTCYQNVTDKTCEDMGYQSLADASYTCTPVTECGLSCLTDCHITECEDNPPYLTECPENYQCDTMTDFAGLTCYKTTRKTQCSDGNYKSGVPDNQVCLSVTYAGLKCFDQCHEPTCEDGGYYDAPPYGYNCYDTTYYGRTCYLKDSCFIISTQLPILYSDMTVDYKIIPDKTPIGIVFDTDKRLAMALEKSKYLVWGEDHDFTSLENCTSPDACPTDGKANTAAIIAEATANNSYLGAATYCNTYTTEGTEAGEWFLPSISELNDIFDKEVHYEYISTILKQLGRSSSLFETCCLFSSNEYDRQSFWARCSNDTAPTTLGKDYVDFALPIIKYRPPEIESPCEIGSVLYENKKCYLSSPKTPIAVVFNPEKKLAIALEATLLAFGGDGTDITGLENCTDSSTVTSCETNGKTNTAAIIAFGATNSISYPAAEYCNTYKTAGTQAGEWFLPSYAELQNIYDVKAKLSTSLNSLGKSSLALYYWTSNEYDADKSWRWSIRASTPAKKVRTNVLPVIQYEVTCEDGGYYTTKPDGMRCRIITYEGLTCYSCNEASTLKTCEDGGYYTSQPEGMICIQNPDLSGTGTITYNGLKCYSCIDRPSLNNNNEDTSCENHGYLTPGSTAACACEYGNIAVKVNTSSTTSTNCMRCGTYDECGGNSEYCFQCSDDGSY